MSVMEGEAHHRVKSEWWQNIIIWELNQPDILEGLHSEPNSAGGWEGDSDKGASLFSTSHKASLAWAKDSTLPFESDLVLTAGCV